MRVDPRTTAPATPPCTCGGRGQCFVCEAQEAVRLSQLKRSAGGGFGAAEFHTRNLLDRPMPMGTSSAALPVVRKMGALLGLPALRNAGPEDTASPLLSRANNLAGMLTLSLIKLPADRREAALEEIGGMGWAQGVLRAAGTLHGKLSAKDAVHFALTLEFIIGATDAQAGRFSPSGAAYVRAYNLMAKAQDEGRADSLGISKRSAMSGFGLDARSIISTATRTTTTTATPAPSSTPTATATFVMPSASSTPATPAPSAQTLSSVLAAGARLTPVSAGVAPPGVTLAPDRWIRVSPDGRTVLIVATAGGQALSRGVYVLYKTGGDPLRTVADAVSAEYILANSEPATGNITTKPYKRLWFKESTSPTISLEMTAGDGLLRYIVNRPSPTGGGGIPTTEWSSLQAPIPSKGGTPNVRLEVQNDGNVVGYKPDNTVAFSLETQKVAAPFVNAKFAPPPEIPNVDYAQFNTEACNWGVPPSVKQGWKKDGIRVAFNRVFGRMPNNAEITYYGAMRWCIDANGLLGGKKSTLEEAMETVRGQILAGKASNTTPPPDQRDMVAPPGTNPFTAALDVAANWSNDILCKGFKALFGGIPGIGDIGNLIADVMCRLVSAFTTALANTLASAAEVILSVVKALIALITGLGAGKPFDAVMGFMRELTVAVFFAVFFTGSGSATAGAVAIVGAAAGTAPVAATFLLSAAATPESVKLTQEKVRRLAYAAADKDPLFPLTLAISVVTVIFAPTPQSILQLAVVLIPVVSALAAPTLQQIPALASQSVDVIQKGLDTLMRLAITVAMGILTLQDLITTIQKQLTEVAKRDGPLQVIFCNMAGTIPQEPGDPNPPAQKNVAWCIAMIIKRLTKALDPKNPQSITAAIQKIGQGAQADGVLDKINTAAVGLLTLLPALVLLFAGGAVESDPSLRASINQYFITANAVPGMLINKDVVEVNTAMKDLLGMLNQLQQGDAVYEQQRILDLQTSAKVTAKALWDRVGRDGVSQADRDMYFQTMRAEWAAAGGKV